MKTQANIDLCQTTRCLGCVTEQFISGDLEISQIEGTRLNCWKFVFKGHSELLCLCEIWSHGDPI